MAEFLSQENIDLFSWDFKREFGVNVVLIRTRIDVTEAGFAPSLFCNLAFRNFAIMDICLLEILDVIAGKLHTETSL